MDKKAYNKNGNLRSFLIYKHFLLDREIAGSNPATPTNLKIMR